VLISWLLVYIILIACYMTSVLSTNLMMKLNGIEVVVRGRKEKRVPVHYLKAYRGSRSTAPLTRNLNTKRKWAVRFKRRPLYPWGKNSRYLHSRRLGGHQMWSGRLEKREIACFDGTRTPYRSACHCTGYFILAPRCCFCYCYSVYYYWNYINYTVYVRLPAAHQQNKIQACPCIRGLLRPEKQFEN
jgi:hypothetical protein